MFSIGISAQDGINWLTWEKAQELHKDNEKKFFVDIYTEWCQWCDKMEKSTLSEPSIVNYINENYYPIRFDAEDKSEIIYKNKVFKPIKSFGKRPTHELAIEIMSGNIGYPTIVFIDEDLKVIQPIQGYQDVKTFKMIMTYFAGNYYREIRWKPYVKQYNSNDSKTQNISPSDIQPNVQTVGHGG
jgi:thioredoxin-related protein